MYICTYMYKYKYIDKYDQVCICIYIMYTSQAAWYCGPKLVQFLEAPSQSEIGWAPNSPTPCSPLKLEVPWLPQAPPQGCDPSEHRSERQKLTSQGVWFLLVNSHKSQVVKQAVSSRRKTKCCSQAQHSSLVSKSNGWKLQGHGG